MTITYCEGCPLWGKYVACWLGKTKLNWTEKTGPYTNDCQLCSIAYKDEHGNYIKFKPRREQEQLPLEFPPDARYDHWM